MRSKILIASSRRLLLIATVFFVSLLAVGEQPESRSFDSQEMSSYLEKDDFSYMNLTVRPPSIWQRLQWWFGNLISKIFANPNSPWLTKIVFYALVLLVLGVAIFYILRLRYGGVISSETKYAGTAGISGLKSAKAQDFDKLIAEAKDKKEYKLAIRYVYLKSLHFLSSKELIKLKDWKSPYDYQKELKGELAPVYSSLSELFEFVWYGDFEAGEKDFTKGSELFVQIENTVK